jgi:hypothetical protein
LVVDGGGGGDGGGDAGLIKEYVSCARDADRDTGRVNPVIRGVISE